MRRLWPHAIKASGNSSRVACARSIISERLQDNCRRTQITLAALSTERKKSRCDSQLQIDQLTECPRVPPLRPQARARSAPANNLGIHRNSWMNCQEFHLIRVSGGLFAFRKSSRNIPNPFDFRFVRDARVFFRTSRVFSHSEYDGYWIDPRDHS